MIIQIMSASRSDLIVLLFLVVPVQITVRDHWFYTVRACGVWLHPRKEQRPSTVTRKRWCVCSSSATTLTDHGRCGHIKGRSRPRTTPRVCQPKYTSAGHPDRHTTVCVFGTLLTTPDLGSESTTCSGDGPSHSPLNILEDPVQPHPLLLFMVPSRASDSPTTSNKSNNTLHLYMSRERRLQTESHLEIYDQRKVRCNCPPSNCNRETFTCWPPPCRYRLTPVSHL
jgi:hypothetical protein